MRVAATLSAGSENRTPVRAHRRRVVPSPPAAGLGATTTSRCTWSARPSRR